MGSPRFLGSPCMRAGFTDPGGLDVPRLVRVRFTRRRGLPHSRRASATNDWAFEAQSHGPHAHCLRFAAALTDGLAQDSFPVGRIPYPGGFRPAGLQVRFHDFLTHRSSSPRLGLAHSRYPTGCERLEHLCKYVLRPPLADRRLRLLPGGLVALELNRPWSDGTARVTMTKGTFLERLSSLVPREREHTILYRGTLGPNAARRAKVVPQEHGPRPKNLTWATLMMHGLAVDVLACVCGARMKHVAVVREKESLARLLRLHRLPQQAARIAPARAPPQTDLDFGP